MLPRRTVVREHHVGVRYVRGRIAGTVGPGVHWSFGKGSMIQPFDTRPTYDTVNGQEAMTLDGATLRATVAIEWSISDVQAYVRRQRTDGDGDWFRGQREIPPVLDVTARVTFRDFATARTLREALDGREACSEIVEKALREAAESYGLAVEAAFVLDFSVLGNLRAAYSDLLKAELEGQAAMQRARNEASTLRSLVNTARLTREHPGLLELRVLTSGARPRVSFVIGAKPGEQDSTDPDSAGQDL